MISVMGILRDPSRLNALRYFVSVGISPNNRGIRKYNLRQILDPDVHFYLSDSFGLPYPFQEGDQKIRFSCFLRVIRD